MNTIFLLVHGAWHSSWQWSATQRELAARGATSLALDLPGHGFAAPHPTGYLTPGQPGLPTEKSALATLTMRDNADAIVQALQGLRQYHQVVLVSHSAGGGPAALAAELAPHLIDRQVYLSAFVPAARPTFHDYLSTPEQASNLGGNLSIGDPAELGAFRINPLSPDPDYVERLRFAYYQDVPAESFDRWRLALSPDLPLSVATEPITLSRNAWGRIPRHFIRLNEDQALTPALQDLMITEADQAMPANPFTVHTLPGSHSPFAARPAELAQTLIATSQ
ncbi:MULTISPECIES: alpha/beta fold hydrolase [unclassified Crossiella]|uniref:alpha/beta fold hydrolase n=1 Tax=unclassified Crossiella TaxID=2620835 RepID=UPI001FFEE52D|nr:MULTISPECIES: alpha/beta fold hydrolase [unclassified Crossiella]MCK2244184.1 alpha/beta fold hydrolase [Crossiella sp. S99.2]MCK2257988.1 alpha/beta fold hydrolase [Crossiella sp. S99.1]